MSSVVRSAAHVLDDITSAAGKGSEALFNARGPSENGKLASMRANSHPQDHPDM